MMIVPDIAELFMDIMTVAFWVVVIALSLYKMSRPRRRVVKARVADLAIVDRPANATISGADLSPEDMMTAGELELIRQIDEAARVLEPAAPEPDPNEARVLYALNPQTGEITRLDG